MKIGIFDSGLGGLIITKAIRKVMPEYDYVYLGDTKRVPYGNRSHEAVYEFTKECVNYLFQKENCAIVIIACNTASARALRRIQQEYLTSQPPLLNKERGRRSGGEVNLKVLGVLIPAVEEAVKYKRVGILGTLGTISSNTFPKEIKKINLKKKKNLLLFHDSHSNLNVVNEHNVAYAGKSTNFFSFLSKVFQNSAPMLVSLAEEGELKLAEPFLRKYLKVFAGKKIEALVLGCTHYPIFKKQIKKILGQKIKIISQDEIVPKKLKDYFERHYEIKKKLSKRGTTKILVTDMTKNVEKLSKKWFGKQKPVLIKL